MHPNRRRKKRSNYGLRTVEVVRGPNGFGFTISGQQPCILSCIVANSPADQAGLRAGDFLISVNGMSVSKSTHDFVVNLIGSSVGPIKMTIAENYYSDSSDEDFDVGKINNRKPKYKMHQRTRRHEASNSTTNRIDLNSPIKKIMRLQNINTVDISNGLQREVDNGPIEYKVLVGYLGTIEMPKQVLPSARLKTVCSCIRKLRQEKRTPTVVLMTILPTCLTLKNATNQILAIYPTSRVVYISSSTDKDLRYFGLVTSAICDNRTTDTVQKRDYLNIDSKYPNKQEKANNWDERAEIEISNSCHVFMTDPKIIEHIQHLDKAEHFNIQCTPDIITGSCLEFPKNASYIVSLVQNMYKLQDSTADQKNASQNNNDDHIAANSPQPSASSNSDSGIGFRDDCGNISDRILVVEFPAQQPLHILPSNSNRPSGIDASNILLENLDVSFNNGYKDINNIRCRKLDLKSSKSHESNKENKQLNNLNNIRACDESSKFTSPPSNFSNRLTVRAMPDPHGVNQSCEEYRNANIDTGQIFTERCVDVPSHKTTETIAVDDISDSKSSVDNISVHSSKSLDMFKTPSAKYVENKKCTRRQLKMLGSYDNLVTDNSVFNHKLSPKVYGLSKPNYSCEELTSIDASDKCGFGSLQDLSTLTSQHASKRNIAQSEPDVRMPRQRQNPQFRKDESGVQNSKESETVTAWATSFEKLLEDPVGLQTFAEFLKKEFSAENIYFWTACERYRRLSPAERSLEAQRIYQHHLCVGAPEPVNIDSHARHFSEQLLQEADPKLFEQAQKQIFNLMKFDSYPRFLKSDLYKRCLAGHVETSLDSGLLLQPVGLTPSKLKKSLSNAEDRRRKSLLPWHRKNRSKSKDRGEVDFKEERKDGNLSDENVHSSKSSLTSQESAENALTSRGPLCRVILSNGSTTVVQIRENETIQQLVNRVLDKRGMSYTSFEVFTDKHPKALSVSDPSVYLAGCEVRIEQRVVFKLDLPNRKVIAVKSKYTKILIDVLKPILNKYNYHLDQVVITVGLTEIADIMQPVTSIDGMRLNVQLLNEFKEQTASQTTKLSKAVTNHSLDELTNKVFKELLHEKGDAKCKLGSDRGSVKSDDWGSENSSGILGKFLRRDSGIHEKKKKCLSTRPKGNSNHSSVEDLVGEHSATSKKPLIAIWKSGVNKLHVSNCSDSEKLYEGLNRAQSSRIEDQRGTEINFELPDFLKDKESGQYRCTRLQKVRHGEGTVAENIKLYDGNLKLTCNYENRNIVPSNNNNSVSHSNQNSKLNNVRIYSTTETPATSQTKSVNPTAEACGPESPRCGEPPPLPPKPKILPIRPSNWGHQNGPFKVPKVPRNEVTKPSLFLEQPTSSFV